jgi:nucleoside-diphosphate-sugar epimerase
MGTSWATAPRLRIPLRMIRYPRSQTRRYESAYDCRLEETGNSIPSHALTLRGYAEAMYRYFGQESRLSFAPFDQWKLCLTERDAHTSWGHIMRSSCVSIAKSRQRLGYNPRFTSLAAIQESVGALITAGRVAVPK